VGRLARMEAVAPDRRLADRYVLEELIATGGMAEVWRGRDEVLARRVAVKILRSDLAGDPDVAERFQREAIAAARLTHPSIISVYDTGLEDGTRYIVMEHFAGPSLRNVLDQRGWLPAAESVAIVLPVLDALAYAHESGLVHRDVKPGNVLVGDGGRPVKVTDFGIAKAAFAGGKLTTTGSLLGTVRYISPEQVEGREVDARSDLYSAGAVMYETLTGRPPFEGPNDVATAMMRLTTDPLPPRAVRPGIPRGVESVVLRSMARRAEDRFPSAQAMRAVLERAVGREARATRVLSVSQRAHTGAIDESEPARGSAFRSWMLVPLILILLAVGAIAAGLALGRLEIGGPLGVRAAPNAGTGATGGLARILAVGAHDFDPEGADHMENPEQARLAIDGDPATGWKTDHYSTADFGRLKDGVGLWIDLGRDREVSRILIRSSIPGWSFELRSGPLGRPSEPLASKDGTTSFRMSSGRVSIDLKPVRTPGLLIWITQLAPDAGRFAAEVAEVAVQGPA